MGAIDHRAAAGPQRRVDPIAADQDVADMRHDRERSRTETPRPGARAPNPRPIRRIRRIMFRARWWPAPPCARGGRGRSAAGDGLPNSTVSGTDRRRPRHGPQIASLARSAPPGWKNHAGRASSRRQRLPCPARGTGSGIARPSRTGYAVGACLAARPRGRHRRGRCRAPQHPRRATLHIGRPADRRGRDCRINRYGRYPAGH